MNDDFFDDNSDDFYDDFIDDDAFEDAFDDDFGPDDSLDNDSGIEDEQSDDICEDEFTANEATMFGVGMGFAYEEGLEEAERRKLERNMDDNRDQGNKHS
jgi:hypothetical protein